MTREIKGDLDASHLSVGVVVASWNEAITERLLRGAVDRLEELGARDPIVLRVPGALEIPVGAKALIENGCDALVAIGTVVKGDTDHYDIVVRESASGISRVALDSGVPIANAILAVHDYQDAVDRSGSGQSNKGREAVDAAVETANAIRGLSG